MQSTAIPHAARILKSAADILGIARSKSAEESVMVFVQHTESASDPDTTLLSGSEAWEC